MTSSLRLVWLGVRYSLALTECIRIFEFCSVLKSWIDSILVAGGNSTYLQFLFDAKRIKGKNKIEFPFFFSLLSIYFSHQLTCVIKLIKVMIVSVEYRNICSYLTQCQICKASLYALWQCRRHSSSQRCLLKL